MTGSLWEHQLGAAPAPRRHLAADTTADVCIVGAGFTGLWTAYHLLVREPALRVVVLEREQPGFGASGRNGGWCSALFPAAPLRAAMRPALAETVDEVGRLARDEGIDCGFDKTGTLTVATNPGQLSRLHAQDGDVLSREASDAYVRVAGAMGSRFDAECAVLQPLALARGLADAVERRGGVIYERTAVRDIHPGSAVTDQGIVRAHAVVRATEAYTGGLPGERRTVAPVYSLVIATAPLPDSVWSEIGWERRVTVTDERHLIVYAQRTADGRIVLGGRGAPYHLASRTRPTYDEAPRVFAHLVRVLHELFPAARGVAITHRWGGPLGVPRDWTPSVQWDPQARMGAAGGYVGDGVAASALAGHTLADLITGADTARTHLPWVGHPIRRWEVEPLRWIGVNGGRLLAAAADARERRTGRPTRIATVLDRLTGH